MKRYRIVLHLPKMIFARLDDGADLWRPRERFHISNPIAKKLYTVIVRTSAKRLRRTFAESLFAAQGRFDIGLLNPVSIPFLNAL